MPIKRLWSVTIHAAQDWWEDNCLRLAASLAYYTALSLAPLVLLLVGVTGMVLGREQVAGQLAAQLESLMGSAGRELVNSILTTTSPEGGTWATVVGLVTLVIGATAVFGELQTTMNLIWEVQPAPARGAWAGLWAWLKSRLFSLGLVFALAFLLVVSLVVSAALAGASALFQGPEQTVMSRLLEIVVSLAVLTLMFALFFNIRAGRRDSLARRLAGRIRHGSALHPRQDGDRLLPRPGKRRLGLRRGRVDGGAPRVGLLLGPDRVLRRRVYAGLGHAPGRCGPPAARRVRSSAPDQGRGGRRACRGGISACPVEHRAVGANLRTFYADRDVVRQSPRRKGGIDDAHEWPDHATNTLIPGMPSG